MTPTVLLGCCRVTLQLPIGACPQHLIHLSIKVTSPHHHSRVVHETCKGAEEQSDELSEDSNEGAQGTGGRSDPTSGQGERNCDGGDYDGKMEEMLGTGTYGKLRGDPTVTQENSRSRKRKGLEKNGEITSALYHKLRSTGSQSHRIYCLPKIDKLDVPLRPIFSCIGSPTYQLSKHITSLISLGP